MKGWRIHLLALGCYALLAIILTYPLILHFGDSFIANEPGRVDGLLSIWNVWWASFSLQEGQNPFFTPLLFHPFGLDLFWLWLSFPNGLLVLPLTLLAGPLPAYNLSILLGYTLGGYTAFLFVRYVTRSTAGALIGGAVYALSPFHTRRVIDAVMDTASIQWVPLYLLLLHLTINRRRWWLAPIAAVLLLIVGLGSWYYGLFCAIYTGIVALVWALGERGWRERLRTFAWGCAPAALWAAILSPRLLSIAQTGDSVLGVASRDNLSNSADLIAFWLPNPYHPLWGEAVSQLYLKLHPDAWLWQVSLGLVGTLLAVVGIWTSWRSTWRWIVVLAITLVLAMGERLFIFGIDTGIPLPYALLADLPGIRTSHRPNHIVIISILLTGLLAGYGALALFKNWPRWKLPLTAGLIAATAAIDGFAGVMPIYREPIPAFYQQFPKPDGGALLPIPNNLNVSRSESLLYQTVHHWPIIAGYTGREPPYALGRYAPGVRELRYGEAEPDDITGGDWAERARAALAAYDIRYVVYHPKLMKGSYPKMVALIDEMGLQASYRDDELELYPVPQDAARTLAYLSRGWGDLERDDERRWRWMSDQAEIRLINPHDTEQAVTLDLTMEAFEQDRPLQLRMDDEELGTITITRAQMQRSIRLLLPPGEHVVYLVAPADPRPERPQQLLSIAFFKVQLNETGAAK